MQSPLSSAASTSPHWHTCSDHSVLGQSPAAHFCPPRSCCRSWYAAVRPARTRQWRAIASSKHRSLKCDHSVDPPWYPISRTMSIWWVRSIQHQGPAASCAGSAGLLGGLLSLGAAQVGTGVSLRPEAAELHGVLNPASVPVLHALDAEHLIDLTALHSSTHHQGIRWGRCGMPTPKSQTSGRAPGLQACEAFPGLAWTTDFRLSPFRLSVLDSMSQMGLASWRLPWLSCAPCCTTDCAIHAGAMLQGQLSSHISGSPTAATPAAPLRLPAAAGLYTIPRQWQLQQPPTQQLHSCGTHSAAAVNGSINLTLQLASAITSCMDASQTAACPVMSLHGLLTQVTQLSQCPRFKHPLWSGRHRASLQVQSGYPLFVPHSGILQPKCV